jgi:hypothetical protein
MHCPARSSSSPSSRSRHRGSWTAPRNRRAPGCSTRSPSWTACARPGAAPGTPSRPTPRCAVTCSRRRTRPTTRSSTTTPPRCARSSATCCSRWSSTRGWRPRPRPAGGSPSTTSPATWSTSWCGGIPTCSATPDRGTWPRSRPAGRRSSRPRSSGGHPPRAFPGPSPRPPGERRSCGARPAELTATSPEELGERLLAVVTAAEHRGWDAEDALREAVRRYAGELDAEAGERATP